MFIDGFLALCTSVSVGACVELTGAGYNRQPIAFGEPLNGVTVNCIPFSFGANLRPSGLAGRAIFDAPTGGNLLMVMPFPAGHAQGTLWDSGDVGFLRLAFAALAGIARGQSATLRLAAGSVIGSCNDSFDIVNNFDLTVDRANPRPQINLAQLTAGVALSVNRGVLQAASLVPTGVE